MSAQCCRHGHEPARCAECHPEGAALLRTIREAEATRFGREFNGHFPAADAFNVAAPLPAIPPGDYLARLINDLLAIKGDMAMDRIAARNTAKQAARVIATFCSPQGEYGRGWDQRATLYTNDQLREALVASADECAGLLAEIATLKQRLAEALRVLE